MGFSKSHIRQTLFGVKDGGFDYLRTFLPPRLPSFAWRGGWWIRFLNFTLPYYPHYGTLCRVGDGGFDLHFSFPQQE